ncbi:hypothetical protein MUU74_06110 [Chryseobacterium daecheongense]|uniref:hypothetical protein n=1 Tax=Chryseobacterium daecheongense TaxID=192389 RepID=UPI001FD6FFB6|nr:hypothetical protein [Chryseobacterium daecheongense]UOU99529.1 hypothetical protein MUU74_06110 [Chryseobacterium daecheongense]
MGIGWNEEDRNWGIYNYKGFEVFFISENSIDASKEVKNYEKISDEKFQGKLIIGCYNPKSFRFYVNRNFKYMSSFYYVMQKDAVANQKKDFEKILRHSYYKKKTSVKNGGQ